jgi:hypothetical protein
MQGALAVLLTATLAGCVTREVIVERVPAPARQAQAPPADETDAVAPRVGLMGDLSDPFAPDSERVAPPAPAVGWNADRPETNVRYYSQTDDYDPEAVTVTRYYYGDDTYYQDAPSAWGSKVIV